MSIVTELEKVLAEERDMLLAGDYEGLQALIERKSRLGTRLAENKPDLPADAYEDLVVQAAQNEALLKAAQRGLHSAIAQVKQISDGDAQKTYSKDGQRVSLSQKRTSIAQKI